jgi:probable rRNA maturation factor
MPASSTIAKIHFHYLHQRFSLADRSILKEFILKLFKKEKKRLVSLNYVFCSDAYLLRVNRQFLRHDFYTDIISFELSDPGQPINAEVYISIERVRDNAEDFNTSFKRELHRVIFHGALHLCGYGDKRPKETRIMRKMEEKYLGLYFDKLR